MKALNIIYLIIGLALIILGSIQIYNGQNYVIISVLIGLVFVVDAITNFKKFKSY